MALTAPEPSVTLTGRIWEKETFSWPMDATLATTICTIRRRAVEKSADNFASKRTNAPILLTALCLVRNLKAFSEIHLKSISII